MCIFLYIIYSKKNMLIVVGKINQYNVIHNLSWGVAVFITFLWNVLVT